MPLRNIYEIMRDEHGNPTFDQDGNAITILVGTEEFTEPEPEAHQEVIYEPEPSKAELLEHIKLLMEKVNAIKE
jgi:hypothetical protein